jgi:hypothetical protein
MSADEEMDIGRFLGWAAKPLATPGRHEDLARIVARYRDDADFADSVNRVFAGAGLDLHVDERDGIVVTARQHSMLRLTVSDVVKRAQNQHRAVIGAVLLAVARAAYPESSMVDDPYRIAAFTTQSIVDALDRAAQAHADVSTEDSGVDEELVEVWRRWSDLNAARPNAQRRSTGDKPGVVNRVCRMLVDVGYLRSLGDTDGGTWAARPRFRFAVADLAEDSDLYALVNRLPVEAIEPDAP